MPDHARQPAPHRLFQVAFMLVVAMLRATGAGAHPAQQPRCAPDEGAVVATRFGLHLCDGAASAEVITHAQPQRGARIAAVDPDGAGAREGLVGGDIIYQVGGARVESGKSAVAALDARRDDRIVHINFWRNRAPFIARIWAR